MKISCTAETAVHYVYGMMDERTRRVYEAHASRCARCRGHIASANEIARIALRGEKTLSHTLPPLRTSSTIKRIFIPRAFLAAAAAIAIVLAGGIIVRARVHRSDVVVARSIVQPAPAAYPSRAWCFTAKGALRTAPAVDRDAVYFGSDDARIYALVPESGALLWEYRTAGRIASVPVVVGDTLYAGSADGNIYCLKKSDGALVWKRAVGTMLFSQLCADAGGVYTAASEGTVIAFTPGGVKRWEKQIGVPVMSALVTDERALIFGTRDGVVYALAKTDGAPLWGYITESHFLASRPRIVGRYVVIGDTDGAVHAIDRSRGTAAWRFTTGGPVIADIEGQDGLLYVASDKVYCIDTHGREVWRFAPATSIDVNCIVGPRGVMVVDKYNALYSLHPKTGICLRRETRSASVLAIASAGAMLFTAGDDGSLCAVQRTKE